MTDDDPLRTRREMSTSVTASAAVGRSGPGNLPLELTSFVGRRTEISEVRNLLSASRLVTLTGSGGVGKTRLALRAASNSRRGFPEGVWLVELADVSDPALLVEVVAATMGVRDESAERLLEILVGYLSSRQLLLVLDNCEQLVDAVAELAETLLRACPDLRVLATSREPLNVAGEVLLRVSPLTAPDPDREPSMQGLARFDAVTLFADRAAAAVAGFELDEDNKAAVAGICARLEGVPLAIELAAARIRTMSPRQILRRLDDRYALLTRGSRTAPTRQQTLRWCVDWSYELCTALERRWWARLSVFAGGFELDAAEQICGFDLAAHSALDVLSSLMDKSILLREETDGIVRFRMLETLRDYGREKLRGSGEEKDLRRRHRHWYRRLALDWESEWVGARQPEWIARLDREQPNLREALESFLSDDADGAADAGMSTAAALFEFWNFRGLYGEGRAWLDRVLAQPRAHSIPDRVNAFRADSQLAAAQGDFQAATALLEQGRALAEQSPTPVVEARIAYAEGALALAGGDSARARAAFARALTSLGPEGPDNLRFSALTLLGWAYELSGDTARAATCYQQILSATQTSGEILHRSAALRGLGVAAWRQGERHRARRLLENSLRLNQRLNNPFVAAFGLEALAWTVEHGDEERGAVLMGAAQGAWPAGSSVASVFPNMARFHREGEQRMRRELGERRFEAALRRGRAMGMDAAAAYAVGKRSGGATAPAGSSELTRRERQVADLVSRGLTNKQIAAKLVISQRTAQGHVEHILTKLGFTSRAQIAAWVVEEAERGGS
ncbi:ATP-binding protein [Nocardia gamkensis]|uniref:ATP-binding protein n=1 Tax=Nocardia gamkensis TaxID=352869 RepID=UPI0037C8A0D8